MPSCERCDQSPSTHAVRVTHAGGEQTLHLCPRCFSEMQLEPPQLVVGLMPVRPGPLQAHACPACGTSLGDLQQSPILGCAHCYAHFRPLLRVQLRKVHGSSQHVGKPFRGAARPESDLLAQIDHAVRERRFEDAARLQGRLDALGDGS